MLYNAENSENFLESSENWQKIFVITQLWCENNRSKYKSMKKKKKRVGVRWSISMGDLGGNAGGAVEAPKCRRIFLGKICKFFRETVISSENKE